MIRRSGHARRCAVWFVVVAVACAAATSCTLALAPPQVTAGRAYDGARAAQVRPGLSELDVQQSLGSPVRIERRADSDVWIYEYTQRRKECRRLLFGVIPLDPVRSDVHRLEISFEGGAATRVVHVERVQ